MKLLSPTDCIELLPATREEAQAAGDLFPSILASHCQPGYYRTAFAEGWSKPYTVWQDGRQLGVVGWSRSCDGGLWFDCVLAFKPLPDNAAMWEAFKLIEAQEKPHYTRFITRRRGMVALAGAHGFTAQGVMMQKEGNS